MAVVARKRDSRRVPYEKLRARLLESRLPWDDAAERGAIGAVLLAPNEYARRMARRAFSGQFYDRGHGWLWQEINTGLLKDRLLNDRDDSICQWLGQANVLPRFRAQFFGSCGREIAECTRGCFWWHGNWYIDRVLVAAKLRANVMQAAEQLTKALDAAEAWEAVQ